MSNYPWRDRVSPKWKRILFVGAMVYTLLPMLYLDGLYLSFAGPYFNGESRNVPLYLELYGHNNAGRYLHLLIGNVIKTLFLLTAQIACVALFIAGSRRRRYDLAYAGLILFALSGFVTLSVLVRSNMTLYNLF